MTIWRCLREKTIIRMRKFPHFHGLFPCSVSIQITHRLVSCQKMCMTGNSHLGMFVTTGCSSRRQFVATASRQDTGSRQQNTDSGRQVTASGQFYKPSQTQESKYSSYALLLLCRLKWKNGSTFNERNFM